MPLDPSNSFADLVPASGSGIPVTDPGFTGYIPGRPKPKEPKAPVFVPQGAKQVFDPNTGTYAPVPGGDEEDDPLKGAIDSLSLNELLDGVKRARKQVGTGWATGTKGWIAEMKPGGGTPRDDFKASLDTIQGGIIMEKLQALKEASKTGASGMGALSEREGARLAAAVSALSDQMSPEELETSFKAIERHALTLQAVRDGKNPEDPEVQALIDRSVGALPAGAVTAPAGTGESDPGMGELSAEQQRAYSAFLSAHGGKPPPAALKVFLEEMTGKQVVNAEDIAAALAAGRGFSTTTENLSEQERVRQRIEQENKAGFGTNPLQTLIGHGATLNLSDEAAGIGNAGANIISSIATGNFDPVGAYEFGRDVERQRIADAQQKLGWAGTAAEIGGSLLSVSPNNALAAVAPTARQATAAATVGGALAGFGAGEGARQSELGALFGAGTGAALQHVGGKLVDRFARSGGRGLDPEAAAAAQAEGVDLIRPMVDPKVRGKFGQLESAPGSQNMVREGVDRVKDQIEGRLAQGPVTQGGAALEPGAAGERLQLASNRFIQRSRGIKDRLYRRAELAAGATRFVPDKALQQIDEEIAQLSGNPGQNATEIGFLQTIRSDLANPDGKTVADIRNIREGLRGEISRNNLTLGGAETRALRVMTAAAEDIAEKVPAAGSLYKRADNFYRERQVVVDDIKRAVLGKPSDPLDPQKAFANIKTLSAPGGNLRRLSAVMRNLEPDERADIATTIAHSIGRKSPDEPFSLKMFLDQTANSKISPAAQRTLFGEEGAQSIANLRLLSRKLIDAQGDKSVGTKARNLRYLAQSFVASVSGLGGAAMTQSASGLAAGVAVAAGAGLVAGGRRLLSARAMLNPRVSMWLARAADVNTPAQAREAAKHLGVIIAREPTLAMELRPLHDFLNERLAAPLAAEPQREGEDNEQP